MTGSRGRSEEQQQAINRYWKGLPLRDADEAVRFVVSSTDIEYAVPGDPEMCAVALTCRRTVESKAVVIFHRVAYVDMPTTDGGREVLRYRIPPKTSEMIEALDAGHPVKPGSYAFQAPRGRDRLDVRRDYDGANRDKARAAQRRHRERRNAIINGEIELPTRGKKLVAGMEGYIRSGTGRVQMDSRMTK